jgi:hypothetical protein
MTNLKTLTLGAAVLTLALAPVAANAEFIQIDDLTDNVTATASFGTFGQIGETTTFIGFFNSIDPLIGDGGNRPGVGATVTDHWNFVSGFDYQTLTCTAPEVSDASPPCLSDTLSITLLGVRETVNANVRVDLTFMSDDLYGPTAYLGPTSNTVVLNKLWRAAGFRTFFP